MTKAKKTPAKKAAKAPAMTDAQQAMLTILKGVPYLSSGERAHIAKDVVAGNVPKKGLPFPSLDHFNIKSHKLPVFVPEEGSAYPEMFDQKKTAWLAFDVEALQVCEMLDTLTYATRQGLLNSRTWVSTVFRTQDNWQSFLSQLAEYEVCYRIRDPWWYTLAKLAEHEDFEEGFSTAEEIADKLLEHSHEAGQFQLLT
jgi:hypothetical protein